MLFGLGAHTVGYFFTLFCLRFDGILKRIVAAQLADQAWAATVVGSLGGGRRCCCDTVTGREGEDRR